MLKGSTMSQESKTKMRRAKLKSWANPEYRNHMVKAHLGQPGLHGPQHGSWRGGITAKDKLLRQSKEYKLWRTSVYERDDYTCKFCGQRGGKLQADHIKPWALFPELRFAIDNGRTLCEPCHKKTPTYGGSVKKLKRLMNIN